MRSGADSRGVVKKLYSEPGVTLPITRRRWGGHELDVGHLVPGVIIMLSAILTFMKPLLTAAVEDGFVRAREIYVSFRVLQMSPKP